MCLYADDSNLKVSANTKEELEILSCTELANIQNFLTKHNLKLNLEKTNYIIFKTAQNKKVVKPTIALEDEIILRKSWTNFLGLKIDEHLKWDLHIEKVISKLNSGVYALSRMSYLSSISTLRIIYFSYIHSHISYGLCLYGATKKSNLDKILKIQKRSIRIMLSLKFKDSVRNHFRDLKILTVYGQYIFDTIILLKNETNNSVSEVPLHSYNTRNRAETITNQHNLKVYEKKPTYMGLKFLKKIPKEIKREKEIKVFYRKLKQYLIDKVVYSFDEFFNN